jgi:hypothetical protein
MIYRLALGQPNQEDFIGVLSRGGDATRMLLQPLVLDLSAMGLRTKMIHASDMNGQSPISAVHPPITEDEDILARSLPTEAKTADRESSAPTFHDVATG